MTSVVTVEWLVLNQILTLGSAILQLDLHKNVFRLRSLLDSPILSREYSQRSLRADRRGVKSKYCLQKLQRNAQLLVDKLLPWESLLHARFS